MNLIWQRRSTIWGLRFRGLRRYEAAVEAYEEALAIYRQAVGAAATPRCMNPMWR
jgi:hypothetical protein